MEESGTEVLYCMFRKEADAQVLLSTRKRTDGEVLLSIREEEGVEVLLLQYLSGKDIC